MNEDEIANEAGDEMPSEGALEGEGRYVPDLGEELSQAEQLEQLMDTGAAPGKGGWDKDDRGEKYQVLKKVVERKIK